MGPADLEEIISAIRFPAAEDQARIPGGIEIIVGPGDDAGVYAVNTATLVETVDVITPVVNDPFTFGKVSTANSVSDIYAMGGRPVAALAILGFPSCDYDPPVLQEILRGALHMLKKTGAVLIGGHSFEDSELKFGLSVTGIADRDRILRVSGARAGDIIIVTKPIGVGVLTTALKGGKMTDEDIMPAVEWMLTLNEAASRIAIEAGATACTDVTGFGLLGHAHNMVRGSEVDFVLNRESIPVMPNVAEMIDLGMVPEGAYNNLRFLQGKVDFSPSVTEESRLLLADPQTSGGLLITLREEGVGTFRDASHFFSVIGRVVRGAGRIAVT